PTDTKVTHSRAEPELLTWWSQLFEVPCVAIGGITADNAPPLVEAGADFLAVSSGVWAHEQGPAEALRLFNRLMGRGFHETPPRRRSPRPAPDRCPCRAGGYL